MKKILIVGATSAIAQAVARCYAAEGAHLHLLARKPERLQLIADDLRVRGATQVSCAPLDVDELTSHAPALDAAWQALGGADVVLLAHGTLPEQERCSADTALALREFHTNAVATLALMNALAQKLEAQGQGTLAVISSVAGDRGRQSNYLYGSAKAAVSTFADGLRNRFYLRSKGRLQVVTIKPGFVDTPMTARFPKGALWASPAAVGAKIHRAIARGRDAAYVPGFWRLVMMLIRHIPEFLFKRLKL